MAGPIFPYDIGIYSYADIFENFNAQKYTMSLEAISQQTGDMVYCEVGTSRMFQKIKI